MEGMNLTKMGMNLIKMGMNLIKMNGTSLIIISIIAAFILTVPSPFLISTQTFLKRDGKSTGRVKNRKQQ